MALMLRGESSIAETDLGCKGTVMVMGWRLDYSCVRYIGYIQHNIQKECAQMRTQNTFTRAPARLSSTCKLHLGSCHTELINPLPTSI
jgi:hypothetical protein